MALVDEYRKQRRALCSQLDGAEYDELVDLKLVVDQEILSISDDLAKAKTKLIQDGAWSDPDWFRRATMAKRIKGQLSQRIQLLMSRKKKIIKEQNRAKDESNQVRLLFDAMNTVLTPEQKKQVVDEWNRIRS